MRTLVYYIYSSLFFLLVYLVWGYLDGSLGPSLEKITIGGVLFYLLAGLLWGAMIKYMDKSDVPLLRWTVTMVVMMVAIAVLLYAAYRVLAMLGIPLG